MTKRKQDNDLREQVLKRDEYTCQLCMKKKSKRWLQVHHILMWSRAAALRFDIGNCISLCVRCHKSIRRKETYYEQYFLEILREKRNR